jgi:hypothetical protein
VNSKAKLLFDECVGHPLVTQLANLIGVDEQEVELSHVLWKGFGGENDDVWIPKIASEGWVIITGDEGKQSKRAKGEKLPIVCSAYRVTYVSFSRAVVHFNTFEKTRTILNHWKELLVLKDAPRGSGYQIRLNNSGHTSLVLKNPPPAEPTEAPKQQLLLKGVDDVIT